MISRSPIVGPLMLAHGRNVNGTHAKCVHGDRLSPLLKRRGPTDKRWGGYLATYEKGNRLRRSIVDSHWENTESAEGCRVPNVRRSSHNSELVERLKKHRAVEVPVMTRLPVENPVDK